MTRVLLNLIATVYYVVYVRCYIVFECSMCIYMGNLFEDHNLAYARVSCTINSSCKSVSKIGFEFQN